jgi:transcription-repair coupling factor (superfamily II helicase)
MLEDAVADLKHDKTHRTAADRDWTPNISLGLPVMIPDSYVSELPVRLGLYRRIGTLATDAETEAMAAELTDRFGPLPAEVENLLQVVALKRACRTVGVEKLEAGPKGLVVGFRGNRFENPSGLIGWLAGPKAGLTGDLKLRPDHKLVLVRELTVSQRVKTAKDILKNLGRITIQAKAA